MDEGTGQNKDWGKSLSQQEGKGFRTQGGYRSRGRWRENAVWEMEVHFQCFSFFSEKQTSSWLRVGPKEEVSEVTGEKTKIPERLGE